MVKFGKRKDGQAYPKRRKSGAKKKGSTSAGGKRISKSDAARKRQQKERERQEKITESEIDSFNHSISNFGSGDITTAIEKGRELNLWGSDVADLVRDWSEETGTDMDDLDIVAIVYEHELQMARNKIDSVLGYDFLNDFSGDTGFYVAGNYMATSFDYSEGAVTDLQEKINEATGEQKDELEDDIFVKIFLEDVEVEIGK